MTDDVNTTTAEDIEKLKARRDAAQSSLNQAQRALNKAVIELAQHPVGSRVTKHALRGGDEVYEITRINVNYRDEPQYQGAKIRKNGTLGVQTQDLYWLRDRQPDHA